MHHPDAVVNYEVHVTCDTTPEEFARMCATLGVRPVHAHNLVDGTLVSTELLTQSVGQGTQAQALDALADLGKRVRALGIEVLREKVELDPVHPDAPAHGGAARPDYLEAHLRIVHPVGQRHVVLAWGAELSADGEALYASYDTMKPVVDGCVITMLTARSFTAGVSDFRATTGAQHAALAERLPDGWDLRPLIVEWAIADDNTALDSAWVATPEFANA